ncbi:serine hydrolase domain-containing protein [Gynurincola endophyticus]|uniref:serine hydrolase domain-containing protein n=1 Tax=Gynurincola endophyticus TaxID=2479004 RepID=UPI000F8CE140|nr:serine hydrolase domain-containing protein [Gynurincola endophyticus]
MSMFYQKAQDICKSVLRNKGIKGIAVSLKYKDCEWNYEDGNLSDNRSFFIASTTKLFTTAIILKLFHEGRILLSDKIVNFFPEGQLNGTLLYKGRDYIDEVTIKQCLMHTSGLPDYFLVKNQEGKTIFDDLVNDKDRSWTFEEIIEYVKTLSAPFPPGDRKAHYSDTNFTILGKIIEIIYALSYEEVVKNEICTPLQLTHTYVYRDINDKTPVLINYKNKELIIPQAMSCFGPDGGAVSNASELNTFLYAFWNGFFFPKSFNSELKVWNNIFYPLKAGVGLHGFKMPSVFTMFKKTPMFVGYTGLNGTVAFAVPDEDFYFSGTVNNASQQQKIFQTCLRIYLSCKKYL